MKPLWTYADLAAHLNVKPGALRSMVSRGQIPVLRISKRAVRFDPDAIAAWLVERNQAGKAA